MSDTLRDQLTDQLQDWWKNLSLDEAEEVWRLWRDYKNKKNGCAIWMHNNRKNPKNVISE